jgi:hypothetical protein
MAHSITISRYSDASNATSAVSTPTRELNNFTLQKSRSLDLEENNSPFHYDHPLCAISISLIQNLNEPQQAVITGIPEWINQNILTIQFDIHHPNGQTSQAALHYHLVNSQLNLVQYLPQSQPLLTPIQTPVPNKMMAHQQQSLLAVQGVPCLHHFTQSTNGPVPTHHYQYNLPSNLVLSVQVVAKVTSVSAPSSPQCSTYSTPSSPQLYNNHQFASSNYQFPPLSYAHQQYHSIHTPTSVGGFSSPYYY